VALAVLAVLAGAAAGLADAAVALAGEDAGRLSSVASLLVLSTSLGACVALGGMLPLVLLAPLVVPRTAAHRIAWIVVCLALAPAAVATGKALYKRLPWSAGDLALVAASGCALLVTAASLARAAAAGIGARGTAWSRGLSRLALPAAVVLLPAGVRIAGAIRAPSASREGAAERTSLLLLSIDTLRADALGTMGNPRARTPCLDRIARRSVVAASCVAPSPWTLPSLGSLLTGTYPGEHRVLQHLSGLSESVPTLAGACARADLRTGAFASNPWLGTRALARGFDEWDVAERLESLDAAAPTRIYQVLSKIVLRTMRIDRAGVVTDRAISWLERGGGAWFLWIHYFDPHLPNWPDRPWDRMFGPPPVRIPASLTVAEVRDPAWAGGDAEGREIASLYFGEIAYTDREVGRLWRTLDTRGELEKTAVVLAADHGEELWDHDGYGHGHSMFDEVIRVPLFLRPPGGAEGRILPGLARLVDLAPTALALAGIGTEEPAPFSGENLLAGGAAPQAAFGEALLYGDELKYLQTERWKLVRRPSAAGVSEWTRLYDLRNDPAERVDLAPVEPEVAGTLSERLVRWIAAVGSETAPETGRWALDPATREQLEALGYIE
jgi:arylsulfatase